MKKFFLLFAFSCAAAIGLAQNNLKVQYKDANALPNFLNVCGDADHVIVTIKTDGLSATPRSSIVATLQLFKGVDFEQLDTTNTSPGVVVTNVTNKNRPVFSVPDLTPTGTNTVQIAFNITANCAYVDSIATNNLAEVFDVWTLQYNLGSQLGLTETDQTDEYRTAFKVPVFVMAFDQNDPPPSKVNDCYSRTLTVANSALEGFVDTLFYTDKLGAGISLKKLYINGIEIPFTKQGTATDTTIHATIHGMWFQGALLGAGLGDGDVLFDPDERIVIQEDICVVSCLNGPTQKPLTSLHTVSWGCKGQVCTAASVNGFARIGEGMPNASITNDLANPENVKVGYCKPGVSVVRYLNNGSEIDPGFATMLDLEVQVGMGLALEITNEFLFITEMKIGNITLPLSNTFLIANNPLFSADPDGPGGFSDEDNDGFFDDLKTGQGFKLTIKYEFNCDSATQIGMDSLCLNERNTAFNAYLKYTNPCNMRVTKSLPNFNGVQHTNEEYLNCIATDAYPGQSFEVQHIETRGVRNFEKNCGSGERLVAWLKLPPGVTTMPSAAQLFKNNSTMPVALLGNRTNGDTLFLEWDATNAFINGKYDFRFQLTPDCTVPTGRINIPFGVYFWCPPCDCKHDWYCAVLDGPQFHPSVPPCPQGIPCPKGLQSTAFDVERTTFGYTNATYAQPMNPASANKNVAIHCDTVRISLQNTVGGTAITDSLGVVISYDNVEFIKDTNEIFLFKRGYVRFTKGAQTFNCALDSTDYSVLRGDTTKILNFRFNRCLDMLGITLAPGDKVDFYGYFLVNPTGPMIDNFRKVPNFRGYGYAVFDGQEYACDNFGENFFVSKIPTVFAPPGGSEFPKGCSTTPFQYRLITKNVGFSQYYTGGESYPAVKVDSLVLDYDPRILDVFQNLKVEVAIPGHPKHGNNFYVIPSLSAADNGHYVAKFDTLLRVPAYNTVASYAFNLRISVTPGCESSTGSELMNNQYKMNPTMYFIDRYFARSFGDGSCAENKADARTQKLTYTDPPAVSFQSVTNPDLLLANDTAIWIVKQCNISTKSDAGITWLSAQYDTSQLTIIGIDNIDNPAAPQTLSLNNYGDGKYFAFTPGLLKQAANNTPIQICNTLRIRAVMKKCGTFPVDLKMGWNCAPYTVPNWNPDLYDPCVYDTLDLSVTALDPSLDATVYNQPEPYPSLCDTLSMDVLVRNTGEGTALDIKSRFSIPLLGSAFVPGSVEVAYPSDGAFVPALADPTFMGATSRGLFYEYADFDSLHAGLAQNGLAGFDIQSPSKTNEYIIRYKFLADCGFMGGTQNFYSFVGEKVCGVPTNTENGESLPIQFAGLVPPTSECDNNDGNITGIVLPNGWAPAPGADVQYLLTNPHGIIFQINPISPDFTVTEGATYYIYGISYTDSISNLMVGNNISQIVAPNLNISNYQQYVVCLGALNVFKSFEVSFGAGSLLNSSGVSSLVVLVENLANTPTDTQDLIRIKLPAGVGYMPGSSIGLSPGSWLPGEPTQISASGFNILTWALPAGIAKNDTAIIRFAVTSPVLDCNQNLEAALSTLREVTYTCPNTAFTCPVQVMTSADGEIYLDLQVGQAGNFAGPDVQICPQASTQLDATLSGYSNYNWSPADGLSNSDIPNPIATLSQTTTYTITAEDTLGCVKVDFLTVNVINGLSASATVTDASCDAANGSIKVGVTGGSGDYAYTWLPNVSTTDQADNVAAGNYLITVTDNVNGCTNETFAVVHATGSNVSFALDPMSATQIDPFSGKIVVEISGGTQPYTIDWSGPVSGTESNVSLSVFAIQNVSTGNYIVTVTDSNGCSDTASVIVGLDLVNNLDLALSSTPDTSCCLSKGSIIVTANGGDGNYTFAWSPVPGSMTNLGGGVFLIENVEAGTYDVTLTDGNGLTKAGTISVADECICPGIFDEEVILEPSGVEAICIGIPYIFIDEYPLFVNGVPYTGPFHPCDFDTVVYYAFSFLNGNGFNGPYKLNKWTCNGMVFTNVVFNDLYDLVDSMNIWDPAGAWILDDQTSTIYGGDPYDQAVYGSMNVRHLPSATPYVVKANYTGFAYGTEIFVNPFVNKVVVTAYDSLHCCSDSVCIIFVNPCDDLVPKEPFATYEDDATICIPVPYAQLFNYYVFIDGNLVNGLSTSCEGGLKTTIPVSGPLGIHELIIIDTTRWCADTVPIIKIIRPTPDTLLVQIDQGQSAELCADLTSLLGTNYTITVCGQPQHGMLVNSSDTCLTYVPDPIYVGPDTICAVICDDIGVCDTTVFVIAVIPTNPPIPTIRDTFYLTTEVNMTIFDICLPTNELTNSVAGIGFCDVPNHGIFVNTALPCFDYIPDQNFVGLDTICAFVCDITNVCDTALFIIMVETADTSGAMPNTDSIYISTPVNTPYTGLCLSTADLLGAPVATVQICSAPLHGDFLTAGSTCVNFVPDVDFIGVDEACLFICDVNGNCDTTRVFIMVTPNDTTPGNQSITLDTISLTTDENTPIASTCLDDSELPGNTISMTFCELPQNGFLTALGLTCFRFEPVPGFVGTDAACVVLCDDLGFCDTTYLIINVLPALPPPTRDTLSITTAFETQINNICVDDSELFGNLLPLASCGAPLHGTTTNAGALCVNYQPNLGFSGKDFFCLVLCDDNGICDTTIVCATVDPPANPPSLAPDTLHLVTYINTNIIDICLDESELPNSASDLLSCDDPNHGILLIFTLPCINYIPDNNFTGLDTTCVLLCDANNVCDSTFIFITVKPLPVVDTVLVETDINTTSTDICLDTIQLAGTAGTVQFCNQGSNGVLNMISDYCFAYTPDMGFVGTDSACVFICDNFGVCDTTIIVINVNMQAPVTHVDSIYLTTEVNIPLPNNCLPEDELNGPAISITPCSLPAHGTFFTSGVNCFEYIPMQDYVGPDDFCARICDATGLCDTFRVFVTVTPMDTMPTGNMTTRDTLYFNTDVNTAVLDICLDNSELTGVLGAVQFCSPAQNGVLAVANGYCLNYTPDNNYIGLDSMCVRVCDDTGSCDTTIIFVLVEIVQDTNYVNPNTDTLYYSTDINTPLTDICLDVSVLTGVTGAVQFCGPAQNGILTVANDYCLTYTPDNNFVGLDSACVFVCDDTGACDTTYIFILVETPTDTNGVYPNVDTLYLTTAVNTPLTDICLNTSDLSTGVASLSFCALPTDGDLVQTGGACVSYLPDTDFIGLNYGCVVLCDSLGTCDTTYLVILVSPQNANNTTVDTLQLQTDVNTPLPNICVATDEIGGNAATLHICGLPENGTLLVGVLPCVIYVPDTDFVGSDTFCIEVCNVQNICDTTIVIVAVLPLVAPPPQTDTLYINTTVNEPIVNICPDTTELNGSLSTLSICGLPQNGTLATTMPFCLSYTPDLDFVGVDSACVVLCNQSGVCDTTFIFITVSLDTTSVPVEPDTVSITVEYGTPTDTFCISTIDITGAVDTLIICGEPTNGTLTAISDSCFVYTPDTLYVGSDTACVILCDALGDCDTTIIIFTVNPEVIDCGIFTEDFITLEISPLEQFGKVCLEQLMLTEIHNYQFLDNGQPYANGFAGCNFDSCFSYTYFTVPDFGAVGPYRLEYWYLNGDTMNITSFANISVLVDSMQQWDPQGGWELDPSTLTIRTCSATLTTNYGDIKIIQLNTAGVAEIELNVNLQPQGSLVSFGPGQHLFTAEGTDCMDSLWINVVISNNIVVDTFIYTDAGMDTLCLTGWGIDTANITDIQFLCPDASGTNVTFVYDSLTHCIIYDGLTPGIDTFCIKLLLGTDSCLYITIQVTALEPLPCTGFIDASTLTVISDDCATGEVCIDFPYALLPQYAILDNDALATTFQCADNGQGLPHTGVRFSTTGIHTLTFIKLSQFDCIDTVNVSVMCDTSGTYIVWSDTIMLGQMDSLCLDTANFPGNVVSITNICPDQNGDYVDFQIDSATLCIHYVGVDTVGTDTACIVVCYDNGICDTTIMVITVLPDTAISNMPPIAVTDIDTIIGVPAIFINVLANDTLFGNPLTTILILTPPQHGTASITTVNQILFEPDPTYCNSTVPDSFLYTICTVAGCDTAWAYVLKPCTDIIIYNGFTPNDDGMNDFFTIEGVQYFPDNHLQIYDRWGQRVFEQQSYLNTWPGTWKNKPLPDGTYFYIFEDGKGRRWNGYLQILR